MIEADPSLAAAWTAHAERVSVRRLLEDVDLAVSIDAVHAPPALDPTPVLPVTNTAPAPDHERQTGAQPKLAELSALEAMLHEPVSRDARVMIHAPRDVARLFRAALCTVRRQMQNQCGRLPTAGEAFEAMLDHATAAWAPQRRRPGELAVFERDGWRCTVPGCSSLRNLHDHHIVFRSHGGSNDLANRTTLCAWHHLRAVHRGLVRCTGTAPHALRFELGIRTPAPPLLTHASGDARL